MQFRHQIKFHIMLVKLEQQTTNFSVMKESIRYNLIEADDIKVQKQMLKRDISFDIESSDSFNEILFEIIEDVSPIWPYNRHKKHQLKLFKFGLIILLFVTALYCIVCIFLYLMIFLFLSFEVSKLD